MEGPVLVCIKKRDLRLAFYELARLRRNSALCLSPYHKIAYIKSVACNNTKTLYINIQNTNMQIKRKLHEGTRRTCIYNNVG